ncbi:MAG: NHLP leader peptide family RiPP precursor [SAR202 cluster bacterium]|nr:NHLP leader peptide family RiPP precursor [SAR202 cluster bacterium]
MAEQSSRAKQEAEIVQRAIEDGAFRQELVANPKAVIERTLGKKFPDSLSVKVVEEDSDNLCIVIPAAVADEIGDDALEDVSGGMVKGRDIGGRTLKPFGGRPVVNQCLDDFWFI